METVDYDFGPTSRNRIVEAGQPGREGAVAALETFYYALNNADLDSLAAVWSEDELAQLNNPVGGITRSGAAITALYRKIFASGMNVQVTFTDAATYSYPGVVVFAGREIGTYRNRDGRQTPIRIRTTRVFNYAAGRWAQVHHHGSIDDAPALAAYQQAARP